MDIFKTKGHYISETFNLNHLADELLHNHTTAVANPLELVKNVPDNILNYTTPTTGLRVKRFMEMIKNRDIYMEYYN